MHAHECRDCYRDIPCDGIDGRNGCQTWNGSNDGCECVTHSADCRDRDYGYRRGLLPASRAARATTRPVVRRVAETNHARRRASMRLCLRAASMHSCTYARRHPDADIVAAIERAGPRH
jgi:hypothetical protein